MWSIGIRSGIITILFIIIYGLIIQTIQLQSAVWSNLVYLALALGIYSGHYYYKSANNGYMTYRQGVQVGAIVVGFTALVSGMSTYAVVKYIDPLLIERILAQIRILLQQNQFKEESMQEFIYFIAATITPGFLSTIIFFTILLIGLILDLIIAVFSRCAKQ